MIADHLVMFADAASAFAALPQHAVQGDAGPVWNPGYAMPVSVTVPDPSGGTDENGAALRVAVSGYFAWISLGAVDPSIRDLPGNACRLISDRDAANAGSPEFILYRAADLGDDTFNTAMVSPVFAGSNYPFGHPPA